MHACMDALHFTKLFTCVHVLLCVYDNRHTYGVLTSTVYGMVFTCQMLVYTCICSISDSMHVHVRLSHDKLRRYLCSIAVTLKMKVIQIKAAYAY